MNTFREILERLGKEFIGLSRRYPAGQELEEIAKKAQQIYNEQKITFSQVDERKLPKAEIKALPLKDKEKAMDVYLQLLEKYKGSIFVSEARKRLRELRGDFG